MPSDARGFPGPAFLPSRSSNCTTSQSKQLLLPAMPSSSNAPGGTSGVAPTSPRIKRLTAFEMATKWECVECFNCTKPFSREYLKVCPMKGIYLLHMDDDTPAEAELITDDPSILLNAITGLASIDTHSFISASVTARLHLDPLHQPGLHVKVANSDRVPSAGMCRVTHIFIDTKEFIVDMFVIPLEGFNMVLGVQ
jgi:hypothetical protein